jgi:hypothetical protein
LKILLAQTGLLLRGTTLILTSIAGINLVDLANKISEIRKLELASSGALFDTRRGTTASESARSQICRANIVRSVLWPDQTQGTILTTAIEHLIIKYRERGNGGES